MQSLIYCIFLILPLIKTEKISSLKIFKEFLLRENLKQAVILKDSANIEDLSYQKDLLLLMQEYVVCLYSYPDYFHKDEMQINQRNCLLGTENVQSGILVHYNTPGNPAIKEFMKAYFQDYLRHQKIQSWLLIIDADADFKEKDLPSEFDYLPLNHLTRITVAIRDKK